MFGLRPFNLLEAVFNLACSAVDADPGSGFLFQRAAWIQVGTLSEQVGLCLPYAACGRHSKIQSQGRSQSLGFVQTNIQSMNVPGKVLDCRFFPDITHESSKQLLLLARMLS